MAAQTDPHLQAWRGAHAALGGRLVDLESHADVAVARTGVLTGATAAAWAEADTGLAHAWETYRVLDQILDQAEDAPDRARDLLTGASVPGAGGAPTNPSSALESADRAVAAAVAVADRLAAAWATLVPRVGEARAVAAAAGDEATERAAATLAELVANDPLGVPEDEVAALERRAGASGDRHAAARAALARLDADLDAARAEVARLAADLDAAAAELAHAATRVEGVTPTLPVPDLDGLRAWLERIAAAAAATADPAARTRVAADLSGWAAAARVRRGELDAALAAARARMRRREQGQGLWTALRAKAGAHRVDEQPDVVAALAAAQDLLWHAPCDLEAAEAALARLSAVLTERPEEER